MNPFFVTDFSISDSLKTVRKSVLIYETIIVKEIFHLCMSGYGPTQIAKELRKRRIETPAEYGKRVGVNVPAAKQRENDDPCRWTTSTVVHILERREYTGCIVNFKCHKKSYKSKKQVKNDPSEWAIFEGMHEAIIEPEVYDTVQKIRDGRRRQTPMVALCHHS